MCPIHFTSSSNRIMNRSRIRIGALAWALVSAAAPVAQVTVPPAAAAGDAPSLGRIAGFNERFRQQFMIHERLLRALDGKRIRELWFRRDFTFGDALPGSTSSLAIRVVPTAVDPADARPEFDSNRPSVTPAFRGTVTLPASPRRAAGTRWDRGDTVRVALQRFVPYSTGQHLCIEIEGAPAGSTAGSWPVDFRYDADFGTTRKVGVACGSVRRHFTHSLTASRRGLLLGGTVELLADGAPHSAGVLMIAGQLASPIDLGTVGMAGCKLHVRPVIQLPFRYSGAHQISSAVRLNYGVGRVRLDLARKSALLGGRLVAQAVAVEPAANRSNPLGVTTSSALELDVSGVLPRPDVTTITSDVVAAPQPFPARGRVRPGLGPVLRLID